MATLKLPSADLSGKTVLVTGGNSGIGKATAVGLASLGAHAVIAARSEQRAAAAVKEIQDRSGNPAVEAMSLDLASLSSIERFAKEFLERFPRLDVLVCNAGGTWSHRRTTDDGFETTFGVNHLGHFRLVQFLEDRLKESAPARVVVVASGAHKGARRGLDFDDLQWERRRYRGMSVYNASKLANVLFTRELARRLEGSSVTANCMHPGFVRTNFSGEGDTRLLAIGFKIGGLFARSPEKGAETVIWLAAAPEAASLNGEYCFNAKPARPSTAARDDNAARRLWEVSEQLVSGRG